MGAPIYIAVDLGAGSGRVFLVSFESDRLFLEEVRRFRYPPRIIHDCLRWDFELIFENVSLGINKAQDRARELGREIVSIGVDSWGVDYGLLGENGQLLSDPACYRDRRTKGIPEEVFKLLPRAEIFRRTGIQFLDFNTLFQLFSERDLLSDADTLLLLPDLINFRLCGAKSAEYTNATTTQMLNVDTRTWDEDLLRRLDLKGSILPEIVEPGTIRGTLADSELKVVSVGSHDN